MKKHPHQALLCLLLTAAMASSVLAQAADYPPPFRGDSETVSAYFDLSGGGANGFSAGPSIYPLSPVLPSAAMTSTSPLTYHVELPNFIDPLPYKFMKIQTNFYWDGTGPLPQITSITGHDLGPVSVVPGATITFGNLTAIPGGAPNDYNAYLQFYMYPNPDWEEFDVVYYPGTDPIDIIVDTVSRVPEPATMSLLGLGGLLAFRRRK